MKTNRGNNCYICVWCRNHGHRLKETEKFLPSVVGVKKNNNKKPLNIVPFLNERLTKFVDVSRWVGTTPQSLVQTIPDMLDGVEIKTVRGPVINEIDVICPKNIYSVSC